MRWWIGASIVAPQPKWYLDPSAFHVVLTSCTRELSIDVYSCCSVVVLSICVRIAELNSAMEQGEREKDYVRLASKSSTLWFMVN